MNYNEQCRKKQCEHYIEWEFYDGDFYEQPYNCTSCKLQGQSYNITEIAKDCPYKDRAPGRLKVSGTFRESLPVESRVKEYRKERGIK